MLSIPQVTPFIQSVKNLISAVTSVGPEDINIPSPAICNQLTQVPRDPDNL